MIAFLGSLFAAIPILWSVWQRIEGTPEQKRVGFLKTIEASGAKFKETGDTSDLGEFR